MRRPILCCFALGTVLLSLPPICGAQSVFQPPPDPQARSATPAIMPPMASSNEADKEQLRLVREQGTAQGKALSWITEHATGPAGSTGEAQAGAFRLVYTLTAPEGAYRLEGNKVTWHEPASGENAHLRVFPMDAGDGRLVLGLTMRATLVDAAGRDGATFALPFAWYPLLNGYGANISLPRGEIHSFRLEIDPPQFWRHDPYNGYRYWKPTVALFSNLPANTQQLAQQPPATEAEEANLAIARPEAEALRRTLANMYKTAIGGKDVTLGDYIVANANEYSEAYWYFSNGKFILATEMENSAARNSHVEVGVMDALTGRFVPGLRVTATLYDASGRSLGTEVEPFMWHPWLWHYGRNWRIPHNGLYRVHVHFDPPPYARYGKQVGNIMSVPVDYDFTGQKLISGQK